VLLQFVNPSVLTGDDDAPLREGVTRVTLLYQLANLADPSDYSTHENQLILAKQLIKHGANVNAVSIPQGQTPLHYACSGGTVTNLDFVELLLKERADPNFKDVVPVWSFAILC
jgi:ankyrin repeat protein